jgi:[ribosomal protein S18]-alanine N-acetyltransferase
MTAHNATIRLATIADAVTIALMSRELIETGLGWSWTPSRVARNVRDRETLTIVACENNQIVGFGITQFGDEHAHLSLLAVRQDYQRRGIGRAMMKWIEASASVAGISTLNLEVRAANQAARRFYRALGFQEIALMPFYYRGREAAVRLIHTIAKQTTSTEPRIGG